MKSLAEKEITEKWKLACRMYSKRSPLAKRIGLMMAQELEELGATDEDIERLFPLTPIQIWLRDEFIDPGMA